MKNVITICALTFASIPLFAQQKDLWTELSGRFKEEPAVFVERSETLNMFVDGDSLRLFSEIKEDLLHLKENSDLVAGKKVYGSHFTQVADLKARTLVWDKNRYREVAVTSFKKNSETGKGIFYDDSYYYGFDYPLIAPRNRTQLEYRENHKDPRFVTGFMFASYLSQTNSSFTIKTTRDIDFFYEVINDPGQTIKFSKTEKGKNVVYEWKAENVSAIRNEDDSPSYRYFAPHIVMYIKSYKTRSGTNNVLSGINDLYKWYYSFIDHLNKNPSDELKAVVQQIKSASKSEEETVRKIFYWVQHTIEYIAFEQGMRGFIPNDASFTCEKKYGDCKDMANLLVAMLQNAGITAYHTWIGTRDLPYAYSHLPTPIVDNHMIATYISKKGEYIFLDATSDYTQFGYPSSMIQGKEALIAKGPTEFEIKVVPEMNKEQNIMTDSMKLKLVDNKLTGSGNASLSGYPKVFAGYSLDRSESDDVKNYVTKLIGKGSNKFFLDDFKLKNVSDQDSPTRINYSFRISDYHQSVSDELYINLNLNKDYYNTLINSALRKSPKENDYKYSKVEFIEFEIPSGYTVDYIPENSSHKGTLLGLDINYKVNKNKILVSKTMYLNYLMLKPEDFEKWNQSVKSISEAYKESIILKKKK